MKRVCFLPVMLAVAGCTTPQTGFDLFGSLLAPSTEVDCATQTDGPFAQQVPAELFAIQERSPDIRPYDNPLSEVAIGEVIDDLTKLEGCWGRYYYESFFDQTAGYYEVETWEFMKFDFAASRYRYFKLRGGVPESIAALLPADKRSDIPFFIVDEFEISALSGNTIELKKLSGEGASVTSDGQTKYYCPASGGSLNLLPGDSLYLLATLQDNYAKSIDSVEPLQQDISFLYELSAEYWIRLDCP